MGSVRAFFELFIYFQGCQPLLFKDLTLALQSNTRTEGGKKKKNTHALFGKLIRLCKLFRFLKPSLLKVQYFTHSLFSFFFSFFFSFSTLTDVFSGENAEANFWRQPDWSFTLERTALRSALMRETLEVSVRLAPASSRL